MSRYGNPVLGQYAADGAAGNSRRTLQHGGVSDCLMNPNLSNHYGPSQKEYNRWKRSGVPTAEVMQSTMFGTATAKGDSAGDALAGLAAPPPPPARNHAAAAAHAAARRANPVTWEGGPPEPMPAPRATYADGRPMAPASFLPQPQPHAAPSALPAEPSPASSPKLSPEQMQQTWSTLMRQGKLPPGSAAQCLVEMPAHYSREAPPPRPTVSSHSLLTIGLHPQGGDRSIRRSTKFTADFRDPFV